MLEVTFQIGDEQQYARRFHALANEAHNMRAPLTRIRDRLVETVGEQFQTEGTVAPRGLTSTRSTRALERGRVPRPTDPRGHRGHAGRVPRARHP